MNNLVCPVSLKMINEYTGRISVFILVVLVGLFIYTENIWFITAVGIDYFFRTFEKFNHSPITWLVSKMLIICKLPQKKINKAPKIFAARLGFFMAAVSIILFFNYQTASYWVAGFLAVCGFADAVFNFCIGCIIYHYIVYPFYKNK
jgi:hypothetical protein